jgi:hypothetical protein
LTLQKKVSIIENFVEIFFIIELQEILTFLENEEKRSDLIYRLKHAGEDSKQVHAFEEIITSFNLHKSPRGIDQTTLLQNTFQYCEPKECFESFRLVSKSWKYAIENMRFNVKLDLEEIVEFEQNGKFPIFYTKYVKVFKKIAFFLDENVLIKWNLFSAFILNHVKKLNFISLETDGDLPPNFNDFLLQFLKNSQITLQTLCFHNNQIINMPIISLPNVSQIYFYVIQEYQNHISNFDMFMKTINNNCQNLEEFIIFGVDLCPPIVQYISENYQEHCVVSSYTAASEILPTKLSSYQNLSRLAQALHPSKIQYLQMQVEDFNFPFEEPWRNYKSILTLCPNLKGICITMYQDEQGVHLKNVLDNMSEENQHIWNQRILYLKSIGVDLIHHEDLEFKYRELCDENKWGFNFSPI